MSKKIYILFLFLSLINTLKAQDIPAKPNPPRLVNDFVMKLNPSELQSLEQKLRGYADSTSTQITVVIVKNTGDSDPYDYAIKLAKDWGVGQKDKNNGLVLLWATETRKLRIVTGRGMEATITDAISNLAELSAQLKNAGLDATAKSATNALDSVILAMTALKGTLNATQSTMGKVDSLAQHLVSGKGTAGKLLTDEELYTNLLRTTRHLALLEQDLRLNPKRYTTVKLKVFGKNKSKDYLNPADDPAYQLLLDSLERDYSRRMMEKQ